MSRSEGTIRQYEKKMESIIKRYCDGEEPKEPELLLRAFKRISNAKLATKTTKMYRAVLYWYALECGVKINKNEFRVTSNPTRSKKQKRYVSAKRQLMLESIHLIPEAYREFIYLHMICGALIGYRLSEIPSIGLEDVIDGVKVTIKNGKHSNGRSLGKYRNFIVPYKYGEISVRPVIERLVVVSRMEGYEDFLRKASDAHGRLARKLFGSESPTLSSLRHQFKINMVAANKDGVAISAAFGHISSDTQKKNYGINRGGRGLVSEVERDYFERLIVPEQMIELVRNKVPSFKKEQELSRNAPSLG